MSVDLKIAKGQRGRGQRVPGENLRILRRVAMEAAGQLSSWLR